MKHRGEPLDFEAEYVYDHEYFGNACSGFGGKTECQHIYYLTTGKRCRKSPLRHKKAKHRAK